MYTCNDSRKIETVGHIGYRPLFAATSHGARISLLFREIGRFCVHCVYPVPDVATKTITRPTRGRSACRACERRERSRSHFSVSRSNVVGSFDRRNSTVYQPRELRTSRGRLVFNESSKRALFENFPGITCCTVPVRPSRLTIPLFCN